MKLYAGYDKEGKIEDVFGPINPVPEKNYKFLQSFFSEVFDVFPDAYVHLGGLVTSSFDFLVSTTKLKLTF